MQTNAQITGKSSEQIALCHLSQQGVQLITKNYRCKLGEIDLIMRDKINLLFIEVRSKRASEYGSGAATITKNKQRKLILTASYFLMHHPQLQALPARFDVVDIFLEEKSHKLQWIPAAFTAF